MYIYIYIDIRNVTQTFTDLSVSFSDLWTGPIRGSMDLSVRTYLRTYPRTYSLDRSMDRSMDLGPIRGFIHRPHLRPQLRPQRRAEFRLKSTPEMTYITECILTLCMLAGPASVFIHYAYKYLFRGRNVDVDTHSIFYERACVHVHLTVYLPLSI